MPGRSSSRSRARRSFATTTWKHLPQLAAGVVRAAQQFLVKAMLRLGEQLRGDPREIRGGGAVGAWVTLAAATSASMTRSVWYQEGPPYGRERRVRRKPASARPTGPRPYGRSYPAQLKVRPDLVGEIEEADPGDLVVRSAEPPGAAA